LDLPGIEVKHQQHSPPDQAFAFSQPRLEAWTYLGLKVNICSSIFPKQLILGNAPAKALGLDLPGIEDQHLQQHSPLASASALPQPRLQVWTNLGLRISIGSSIHP